MERMANKGDDEYLFARKSSASEEMQRRFSEKRWVWVPCSEAYASGFVTGEDGENLEVDCGGTAVKVRACDVFKMNPPKFDMAEDLAELSYLNEPGVLHNLRRRYQNGLMYTYSGLFLLAINPYRDLRIYGEKEVRRYTLNKKYELEPHIFAVANEAYNLMLSNRENQSVLITGESGAGKTENTKRVVEFLARVAGYRGAAGVDRQIIDANPILEAFGNAQTVKNDNSSRFGKFVKIKFSGGNICGAHIEKYLLEKSRVTSQNENERNYHIFYQLLGCSDPGLRKALFLEGGPGDYRFLKGSRFAIPDVDDGREFERLREAMDVLNIREEEQMAYFRIVSAILHLGNIEFGEKNGTADILNIEAAERVCRLLSISLAEFIKCLIHPVIKAGNEYVAHSRTREQVLRIVDALARILYDKMFDSVIERLNRSLSSPHEGNFIGVLDIAGFEIFRQNSFEQLCINYTNEKLQQFFNHHMFILEQEIYRQERIEWDFIDFGLDLQPTIDLIEKSNPIGILSYLDEECVMPMATEKTFLGKLAGNVRSSKFEANKLRDAFTLSHYAGDVEYVVDGWLTKNKDPHSEALTSLIQTSDDARISSLSLHEASLKKGFFRTVGQKHKEQLASLMEQLCATNPHFVRCIIPNLERTGEFLDSPLVLGQLKCNGVLEGIRISRQGFPSRMGYQEFARRYRIIGDVQVDSGDVCGEFRGAAEQILGAIGLGVSQYRLGQTKVFFRQGVLADIEDVRDSRMSEVVRDMQALVRKRLAFRKYNLTQRRMQSIAVIQKNARVCCELQRWSWWRLYLKIKPLLDVRKRDNEMKEKDAAIGVWKQQLEEEKARGERLEERLRALSLVREELEADVENEKRFSEEKDELLTALRNRGEEMERILERMAEEKELLQDAVEIRGLELESAMNEHVRREEELGRLRRAAEEQSAVVAEQEGRLREMQGQLVSSATENRAQVEALLGENAREIEKLRERIRQRDEDVENAFESVRRAEESSGQKERAAKECAMEIEELRSMCSGLRRWKDEYEALRGLYETMQKKLNAEVEDVQVEKERLGESVRKLRKMCDDGEFVQKKLRDDLEFERSRGDKVESGFQSLRREYGEMEEQLQRERQFKDATQESLLEKIRMLEKKVRSAGDELRDERMMSRQLVGEKEEMYAEIQSLQKSKLDEIFEREAAFNSARKSLQMEMQRLEMENQRLGREVAEMRAAGETSEESASAAEKFYVMLEQEKKRRRETEHQAAEQEKRNVLLTAEIESLRDMVEVERRGREEMLRDQEWDVCVGAAVSGVRKEIEEVQRELVMVADGFNTTYLGILAGYKGSLRELQEGVLERECIEEELRVRAADAEKKLQNALADCAGLRERIEMLEEDGRRKKEELEELGARHSALGSVAAEREEEIGRYAVAVEELSDAFRTLAARMDEEMDRLHRCDEERRRWGEEMRDRFESTVADVVRMEKTCRAEAEESARQMVDDAQEKLRMLQTLHDDLNGRFEELTKEHEEMSMEVGRGAVRIAELERSAAVCRESEESCRRQMAMYESEMDGLRRCARLRDAVAASGREAAVVRVMDMEKHEEADRRRLAAENEKQRAVEEKMSVDATCRRLQEEMEALREELGRGRAQLLEMKRNGGCQTLLVNQLTRELEEEREMVRFLRPLSVGRRRR